MTALFNVDDYIVDLLQQQGMITDEQISLAKERLLGEDGTVLEGLYALKVVSEQDVMQLLGAEYGMDTYDFDHAGTKVLQSSVLCPRMSRCATRWFRIYSRHAQGRLATPLTLESLIHPYLLNGNRGVVSTKRQIDRRSLHDGSRWLRIGL